jgi:hypothetical protein
MEYVFIETEIELWLFRMMVLFRNSKDTEK